MFRGFGFRGLEFRGLGSMRLGFRGIRVQGFGVGLSGLSFPDEGFRVSVLALQPRSHPA